MQIPHAPNFKFNTVISQMTLRPILASVLATLLVAACGSEDKPNSATTGGSNDSGSAVSSAQREEAEKYYEMTCVTCHGKEGKGDGPGSASLDPKPRNFGDPEWQKSVTDKYLSQIIVYGGSAVGKSATMPPNPLLKEKPKVVEALVQHVRSLGK